MSVSLAELGVSPTLRPGKGSRHRVAIGSCLKGALVSVSIPSLDLTLTLPLSPSQRCQLPGSK